MQIMNIEQLENFQLHDYVITSIALAVEIRTVDIRVAIYNEQHHNCDELRLIFTGISTLSWDIGGEWDELEIYSHEVTHEKGVATVSFCLLLGSDKPSATLVLTFTECSIELVSKV